MLIRNCTLWCFFGCCTSFYNTRMFTVHSLNSFFARQLSQARKKKSTYVTRYIYTKLNCLQLQRKKKLNKLCEKCMIQVMSNSALLIRMDCLPRIVSQWVTIIYEGSCSFIYKRLWQDIHEEYMLKMTKRIKHTRCPQTLKYHALNMFKSFFCLGSM